MKQNETIRNKTYKKENPEAFNFLVVCVCIILILIKVLFVSD